MGSRYFQRPENAISKADEFLKVGKPSRALDTLYEVIKSKKRNHTYSEKLIEEIMFRYLELCVELKKSHVAKEGLFQYRNMCQSTNVASLASVVQGYLTMAEKRTENARNESIDSVEVDDLENLATPEMIMLSAVSGEGAQDRSDRTILMPWVKFLWESYCQCLELLRTNSRVERLYHNIAQQAFKFCLKYQRKTEFRKLCDKLRNHLDLIIKQQNPTANTINLNNPDTQQMNLDTRLVQLDAAIQMELWQEAYKAVEDIHGLMSLSKKVFQPKMMANYYQKLALVFWKSGNFLFHAAAVFKHFQLTREMKKNISAEELAKMASRVLAACLCVPLPSQHPEFDRFIETDRSPAEKMARLAVLLALSQPPTRSSLLKDCQRFGVVGAAGKELQDLYNWLEVDFHPLKLCGKVDERLKLVDENEEFAPIRQYTEALRDMTLIRLLKQVAQVYQSVSMKRLLTLTKFASHHHMERLIVECARNNDMQVRIDHRTGSVHFGTDLSEAQRTDLPEGPHIQSMPSEQVRTQLMSMMSVLDKSLATIHPDRNRVENAELRQRITEAYHQSKVRDHQRLLARHKIIEERKEWLEKYNNAQQEAAIESKRKEIERQKAEEAKRLQIEREEREKQRKENEIRDIQAKHTRDKIAQLANTEIGKKVLEGMPAEEIAKMDADEIMAKQVEELEKEKKELQVRLKAQEKKVDHLERAKRLEEIPLLKLQFEEFKEEAKVVWEEQEKDRIEGEKKQRASDVENRNRLVRMKTDKEKYLESLLKERKNIFEKKIAEFDQKVAEERKTRLERRKEERIEERRRKWMREKEEEEQRRRDELAIKEREEREAREAIEKQREKEEYEKKKAELEEIERKKREKEREIEERLERERKERNDKDRDDRGGSDRGPWRAGGSRRDDDGPRSSGGAWRGGGGSWRDREKRKEDEWGPRGGDDRRRDDDGPRRGSPRRGSPPPRRGSPPPRDSPRGADGGGWRRRDASPRGSPPRRLSPRRGGGRDEPRRDDGPRRGSPPRRDFGDRDGGSWRSGPRDDGPRGGDRGGPRGGGRDFGDRRGSPPRRMGDRSPRRGSPPRRDYGRDDDRRGPPPRRSSPDRDGWRRGGDRSPPRRGPSPRRGSPRRGGRDDGPADWRRDRPAPRDDPTPGKPRERPAGDHQDDGWTTVKR